MNSFEERLLDYLASQENAMEDQIRQHFRDDPEYDEKILSEYLVILNLSNSLKIYRQADLQDAWNKIVDHTDLAEEEAAEKIISEIEPTRKKVVTSSPQAREVAIRKESAPVAPVSQPNEVIADSKEVRIETGLSRGNWWTIAASLLLAIGTTAYFAMRTPYQDVIAMTEATVLYLPDNTKVTLEKGATIKHLRPNQWIKSRVREVYVSGEVIFDVVSDPSRPFLVKSDLTQVQVLGTIFKFSASGNLSAAENIEGKVDYQVLDGSNSAVLDPGDKASYDGNEFLVVPFKLPEPPPPPPAPPTNSVVAADLLDILSERYPASLVLAPYMPYNMEVIECNLNDEMPGLFSELVANKDVDIEFSFRNGSYRLSKLVGKKKDLNPDYDYFDFVDGKPFKKEVAVKN